MQKLQAALHGDAIALAEQDMAQRKVQFQQWVEKQAAGGGGGLHAVSRLPIGFDPSPVGASENENGDDKCQQLFEPLALGQQVT